MSSGPFAAVLLAGGRSRRMGCDKATLPLPDGRRLWERQLAILRALEPAELFVSGPAREGFPSDVTLLADDLPGLGPLAGIATALKAIHSPRLLVLAVDLPAMTTGFLCGLLKGGRGIVPQWAEGFYEPLAAVYPRAARAATEQRLQENDLSLQPFVRDLIERGLATAYPITGAEAGLFANWNRPEDLQPKHTAQHRLPY